MQQNKRVMAAWFFLTFVLIYVFAASHPFAAGEEVENAVEEIEYPVELGEVTTEIPVYPVDPPQNDPVAEEIRTIRDLLEGLTLGASEPMGAVDSVPPEEPSAVPEPDRPPSIGASGPVLEESGPTVGISRATIGTSRPTIGASGKDSVKEDLAAIRKDLDILLYGVIPVFTSLFLLFKFCRWFYCAFIQSAFEHI